MVVAPQHPHVRSYDGENPFDIVESPWGSIERWRAVALSTGELGALASISADVRADASEIITDIEAREAAVSAREQAITERERLHAVAIAQFVGFVGQACVLFDRIQKARADQEREPIALPPDNQHKLEGDSIPGTSLGDPSNPSKLPAPPLEVEGDSIPGKASGDLRAGDSLRLKMPVAMDQAKFPEGELPAPPTVHQPIADALDREE